MAEGRGRDAWRRTALLCMVVANSNPFRKGRRFTADDFDPYAAKHKRSIVEVTPEAMGEYRKAFTGSSERRSTCRRSGH